MGAFLENKVCTLKIKVFKKFQRISFIKVDLLVKYSSQKKKSESFGRLLMPKNDFENTNFANFEEVVHNFGRSDDDMI